MDEDKRVVGWQTHMFIGDMQVVRRLRIEIEVDARAGKCLKRIFSG
jgi:hypothetical protein